MKNITIAGRIGKSAETRRTQAGDPVTSFSVAVDDRSQKEKTTLWFDCSLWGKRGDALAQYLTKGTSVTVSGDLGQRTHEGKTYLTVRTNDVTLQGGKQEERAAPKPQSSCDRDDPRTTFEKNLDDTIPF